MTTETDAPPGERSEPQSRRAPPPGYWNGRWFSFRAALSGAADTLVSQPNARVELLATLCVVLAGWWLRISPTEWAILGLSVAVVLALEAVNTGIEAVVDLVSPDYHPLAKRAKDAAAGALIFAVLGSLWVALWILGPPLWQRLF